MRQLINQYSLGGKRFVVNLSYATEILPNPPVEPQEGCSGNQEPLFSWKNLYESNQPSLHATNRKIVLFYIVSDNRVLFPECMIII